MMFKRLRSDIQCILDRDPAARSRLEVLTCYPGVHALIFHRISHRLWYSRMFWLARFISNFSRWFTGIEIHPAATIGERVFLDHAMGVVIGETAVVGDGCTIYQGVTLGGTTLYKNTKRHPTLGKDVVVGAGAKVLGGFEVGDGARIGSNSVVTKAVPKGATAVGNPARIIEQSSDVKREEAAAKMGFSAYGVSQNDDPVSQALRGLIDNAQTQEEQIALLWATLEKLSKGSAEMPQGAVKTTQFQSDRLNKLLE